jgi:hypothetical protein
MRRHAGRAVVGAELAMAGWIIERLATRDTTASRMSCATLPAIVIRSSPLWRRCRASFLSLSA